MGMIAFTIILGDSSKVIAAVVGPDHGPVVDFFISRNFITTVLTLGISYPLSLYRDIEKLSHASALALISCVHVFFSLSPTCLTLVFAQHGRHHLHRRDSRSRR